MSQSCGRTYHEDGSYTSFCRSTDESGPDDSVGVATMWIVIVLVVVGKAVFWTLVCYFYRKRRRRIYFVAQPRVITRVQASTTPMTQQGANAAAIPVALPVSGSQGKGLPTHAVEPPSYYEAAAENAESEAAGSSALDNPGAAGAYVPEPVTAVAQQQPVEGDRVGLLAE